MATTLNVYTKMAGKRPKAIKIEIAKKNFFLEIFFISQHTTYENRKKNRDSLKSVVRELLLWDDNNVYSCDVTLLDCQLMERSQTVGCAVEERRVEGVYGRLAPGGPTQPAVTEIITPELLGFLSL